MMTGDRKRLTALLAVGLMLAVAGCRAKASEPCAERTGDGLCVESNAQASR
jgi:hypothetical protein